MCGICGFAGFEDKELLKKMTAILAHRGPDQHGYYTNKDVSLGHQRLSIIDLSKHGQQPIENEDGSVQLVYNGEIYNFESLRKELTDKGHQFRSRTDSEVVVHAYEEWGESCLDRFRGMFAFALWDEKEKKLTLVRDRIGIKPLYYTLSDRGLLFASEIKSILEDDRVPREVNYYSYRAFLAFQYVPGEETMFSGIRKLLPGHVLTYQNSKISVRQYWNLNAYTPWADDTRAQELEKNLQESVCLRLISDVPLGVFLSGGLDSSLVTGIMSRLSDKPVKTFSVGFGQPDDELPYARLIARKFRTDHHEFIFTARDVKEALPKIVWHMDEPLADGGAIPTYLMSKKVKEHVKVVLVGEGADESFAGYPWHRLALPRFQLLPEPLKWKIYFYLNTYFRENRVRVPKEEYKQVSVYNRFIGNVYNELKSDDFLKSLLLFEINNLLPNSLLMKVDKMTMAHSLEARVPYLDNLLLEYSLSLPRQRKLTRGSGKRILREVSGKILPEEIIKRRKHGFIVPLNLWLNTDLKPYVQKTLLGKESHARQFFSEEEINNMFSRSRNRFRTIENTSLLWRLLIFELWHDIYIKDKKH